MKVGLVLASHTLLISRARSRVSCGGLLAVSVCTKAHRTRRARPCSRHAPPVHRQGRIRLIRSSSCKMRVAGLSLSPLADRRSIARLHAAFRYRAAYQSRLPPRDRCSQAHSNDIEFLQQRGDSSLDEEAHFCEQVDGLLSLNCPVTRPHSHRTPILVHVRSPTAPARSPST